MRASAKTRRWIPALVLCAVVALGASLSSLSYAFGDDSSRNQSAENYDYVAIAFVDDEIEIPYGVDIQGWLSGDSSEIFTLTKMLDGEEVSSETVSGEELARYFEGDDPILYSWTGDTAYPSEGEDLTECLSWATSSTEMSYESISTVTVTMAEIGQLPSEVVEGIVATTSGNKDASDRISIDGDGYAELWLDCDEDGNIESVTLTGDKTDRNRSNWWNLEFCEFSDELQEQGYLDADGSFSESNLVDGQDSFETYTADSEGTCYIKLDRNLEIAASDSEDAEILSEGQIFELPIGIDCTAPSVADAGIGDSEGEARDLAQIGDDEMAQIEEEDGSVTKILVCGECTILVQVQDLAAEGDGADGSSGVEGSQATVSVASSDSLEDEPGKPSSEVYDLDEDGWIVISLDEEGLYDLEDISIAISDAVGNELETTLAEYVASLSEEEAGLWPDKILVDLGESTRTGNIYVDEDQSADKGNGNYYRGDVTVVATFEDPWFGIYQSLYSDSDESLVEATCEPDGDYEGEVAFEDLYMSDLEYDESTGLWTTTYPLPVDSGTGLQVEGEYELRLLDYGDDDDDAASDEGALDSCDFAIDYTAPSIDSLEFSSTGDGFYEGWLFADGEQTVTIGVSDNLSGISSSYSCVYDPEDSVLEYAEGSITLDLEYDEDSGTLSFSLSEDGDSITFDGTTLTLTDVAGNETSVTLADLLDISNLTELDGFDEAIGTVVDGAAPEIKVTYAASDGNEPEAAVYEDAAYYYAEEFTATITIEEANFNIIKAVDSDRVIATITCNGEEVATLQAADFENPSRNGSTWVATYTFEGDGDWTIDVSLQDPAGYNADPFSDAFTIDTTAPAIEVGFDDGNVANGKYYKELQTVTIEVCELNFDPEKATVDITSSDGDVPDATEWVQDEEDATLWTCTVEFDSEGEYVLSVDCEDLAGNTAAYSYEFVIDVTDPVLDDVVITGSGSNGAILDTEIAEVTKNHKTTGILAGTTRKVTLYVSDALSGIETNGSGEEVVTISISRADSLTGETSSLGAETYVVSDGKVTITLDDEGLYPLDEFYLTASDKAGNELHISLAEYDDESGEGWDFSKILVDQDDSSRYATLAIDESASAETDDGYYYRGQVTITVTISDPWFEVYQSIYTKLEKAGEETPLIYATCMTDDGGEYTTTGSSSFFDSLEVDVYDDFDNVSGDKWTASYTMPKVSKSSSLPEEGVYHILMRYTGISGLTEATTGTLDFAIDYTAPTFDKLTLSNNDSYMWEWVFAWDQQTFTIAISDNLSGVDTSSGVALLSNGSSMALEYDSATGAFSFYIAEDGERITFDGTSLFISDIAGNATTVNLSGISNSNIPEDAVGTAVDDAAPVITVTYDYNDASNGTYYNQERTATITIVEANFDFIVENDPYRDIVTITRDGTEITLQAEDFENPSGDGLTWVATYTFNSDGDWTIDVSLTDPAGRVAESFQDAFTIDTTLPYISITFDNDDAENGMYYKDVRTATIQIRERNFDSSMATVTTTASEGTAPSATAWTAGEDEYTWVCTVYFGDEVHYTLDVECTDLADNDADPASEPEFVIDMTMPELEIGGVEDMTAYADVVAPYIVCSDINFDYYGSDYQIVGASQGEDIYLDAAQEVTDEGMSVLYSDFEYEVSSDDVYTLSVTAADLAGNETSQELTFSVNRYGSNYVLVGDSANLSGSYLQEAQDVLVREINVSGLDTSESHVELVQDSRVTTLSTDGDYTVEESTTNGAWSDTLYTFPASLFEDDGYYRLILTSEDEAGNLSQNTMDNKNETRDGSADISFAVDGTAPSAELIGVESGGVYLDPAMTVSADVHDNLEIESASVSVDGEEVASWSSDELDGTLGDFDLDADGESHDIVLTSFDRAGNKTVSNYDNIVVVGNWFDYILNTPSLLYGIVAGLIAAVAAVVIAAVLYRRHRAATESQRNPFGRTRQG